MKPPSYSRINTVINFQICVAECPKENWAYALALNDKTKLQYCKPEIDLSTTSKVRLMLIPCACCMKRVIAGTKENYTSIKLKRLDGVIKKVG